jgi:hypothetical protein
MLVAVLGIALFGLQSTPFSQREPLRAGNLVERPAAYPGAPAEFRADVAGTYDNPFDPDQVALDVEVQFEDEAPRRHPGYFTQDALRRLEGRREQLTVSGGEWRFRWTPLRTGRFRLTPIFRTRQGEARGETLTLPRQAPKPNRFVRVSPDDRRHFAYRDGRPYFPVGINLCWGGDRGTFAYDDWLERLADQGANWGRLWLSPEFTTFALEVKGSATEGKGLGFMWLPNAWRLEYVLAQAERRGIHLMVCIDSFNILKDRDGFNYWEQAPHNLANGGPLARPEDFWTNPTMRRHYRNKLRYLVARYGAFPGVFAWEFWNEVDLTRGFRAERVQEWHKEMSRTLRELDPYDHMHTTSFAATAGVRQIDQLAEMDFTQTHHYSSPDIVATVVDQQLRKTSLGKPHLVGEIGADWQGPRADEDAEGMQIHDPMWAMIGLAGSGTAMGWWWDNLVEPKNLYGLFDGPARFTAGIDWAHERFRVSRPTLSYVSPGTAPRRTDLEFRNGNASWQADPLNRPLRYRIARDGAGAGPLPGVFHGRRNHPALHNPVTLETDFPHPVTLQIRVGDVSGHGGAALRVRLDGQVVLTREFADPDGNDATETLTRYRGTLSVPIPAGRRRIEIVNFGPDWFFATVQLKDAIVSQRPPLDVYSAQGETALLAWMRPTGRSWQRVKAFREEVTPVPPTQATWTGMARGTWKVELWDTYRGTITREFSRTVGNDGRLSAPLPSVSKSLALRAKWQGP